MIEHFYEEPGGLLFMANGIGPMLMWDGQSSTFDEVGLNAPLTAPVISTPGAPGPIVGTYWAYVRFLDSLGNVSNLSPISAQFDASGTSGVVTSASNASPIVIGSPAHGLPTGAFVKIVGVGGNTSANNTWVITAIDANHFFLDDSHGTAAYNGGGTWTSGVSTISYSAVATPTESKVVRRQILRNTDGEATTFYVDVDTYNLTSTTFSSTQTDSFLQSNEAVPILDPQGNIFANRNGKPLNYFPYISSCLSRMFACGNIDYNVGAITVTFGSTTVVGVGTKWKASLATRFLYVDGATKPYQIDSVDETAQTLTLLDSYAEPSSIFSFYSIKPPPAYRRIVQYSEAGLPQSWPPANGVSVQETGDEFTGIMQKGSFVFILERRHIHKMTFSTDPATDGAIFMVATRGCVNNRCWITVDDDAFMLDELGIHKFSGNAQVDHVSGAIQTLFRSDAGPGTQLRVNWRQREFFHASLDPLRETIRWHVSMDGSRYPRHAICLQYRTGQWAIEEAGVSIGGTCTGYLDNIPQVFYGLDSRKVAAAWTGTLDLADPATGASQGEVTAASSFTVTADFPVGGASNTPLAIVDGTGKGQTRRIVSISGTDIVIDRPWSILPDETSVYQIGAIHWLFRSAWFRVAPGERLVQRRFEMLFEPSLSPVTATLRFYDNFALTPTPQARDEAMDDGDGIQSTTGSGDLVVDMTLPRGYIDRQLPSAKEYFIHGRLYTQYELEGYQNGDIIKIYQLMYEGLVPTGDEPQLNP